MNGWNAVAHSTRFRVYKLIGLYIASGGCPLKERKQEGRYGLETRL